jgi:hypothetical protein
MSILFPWVGVRRIAVVPVFNRQVDAEPSSDWEYQVRSRVFYDPDPVTGLDRSFQNYLQSLSYGRAFLDGQIFPPVWAKDAEVNIPAMKSLPPGHGYTHLLAVLPHSFGANRSGIAFWDFAPVNGITAWARVALYDDRLLTVRQPIGVWGMEILHMMTHFTDLYLTQPNLGNYDVMAGAGASTHPTAHTKTAMGWLPFGKITEHRGGTTKANLQAIALPQPPPPDRATAVLIRSRLTTHHFLVEARLATDQYERKDGPNDGIPKDGVIVYEVADTFSVFLRAVLSVGEQFDNPGEGLRIRVTQAIQGGFSISVQSSPSSECAKICDNIAETEVDLKNEKDPIKRRQLNAEILRLKDTARRFGCSCKSS